MSTNPLRSLPAVHEVLQAAPLVAVAKLHAHDRLVELIRQELAQLRTQLAHGEKQDTAPEAIACRVAHRLDREERPKLRRVINATGIILHTNLGRAPVAVSAAQAAHEAALGYLNLELDLETGKRSSRQDALREWLCRLTGAESATAVNNNAAATVLALRALCQGREVIVSRGQLIEIGGSFRIPEIMAVSGAILREVGTTNITRATDFERAIGPNTAALLRIHTSNYRISGFTQSVPLAELVALGKQHNLLVLDDAGSGALVDFARFGFQEEPVIADSIKAGADLVLFSGDKLLGGPQAGILCGRRDLIGRIEKDPLMRAFRLDKMTLAALEATLRLYLREEQALAEVPVLRMLATPLDELHRRATALAEQLVELGEVHVVEDVAYVGGGSLPDQAMKTWVIELRPPSGNEADFAQRLRLGEPAVMARVRDGKLVLDLRTVFVEQETVLVAAMSQLLKQES